GAAHARAPRRPGPARSGGTGRAGGRRAAGRARRDRALAAVPGQAQLQEGVVGMNQDWPVTELDPVRRMRVLAAATPGVAYAEKLIPAPFSAVWDAASDLEHQLPRMITDLRSFEITSTRAERMTARARGRLGQRARFDVVLRPGWCVMQSRFLIGGWPPPQRGTAPGSPSSAASASPGYGYSTRCSARPPSRSPC